MCDSNDMPQGVVEEEGKAVCDGDGEEYAPYIRYQAIDAGDDPKKMLLSPSQRSDANDAGAVRDSRTNDGMRRDIDTPKISRIAFTCCVRACGG
jgi:hypothetical protein